jgi:Lipase maturation factor
MSMWLTLWVRYLSIVGWRLPRQWASYHLRLDWLMRFAAISPGYAQPWLTPFLRRLLRNDPPTLRLLGRNPFPESPAPVRARATLRVPLHHAGRTAARPGMVAPHASGWIRPAHDGAQDDVPAQQLSAGRTGSVYFW